MARLTMEQIPRYSGSIPKDYSPHSFDLGVVFDEVIGLDQITDEELRNSGRVIFLALVGGVNRTVSLSQIREYLSDSNSV